MHRIDDHKPSVEAVEKVVKKFPSTLSYVDEDDGSIPIQFAATSVGYNYVPILAKEGMKHNVGGEDARGGLLKIDPGDDYGYNTLQCLVNVGDSSDANDDAKRVNVMKELRRSGLLLKQDIREFNLLNWSFFELAKKRFEYLVNWDPDALIETTRIDNQPLIHSSVNQEYEKDSSIHLLLKAGFKYHPKIGVITFYKKR